MGLELLLGNQRLKDNLGAALGKGRLSHFYLISGPRGSGKHTLATLLAAAMVCKEETRPCLSCPACRKVRAGTHPDVILMDDPERKTVPVELVRQAIADVYIRPNEADRKIYLFPRAQDMQEPSQNALLKILEEPPPYGVFLLLTDNPDKLLPTIRSRCMELAMTALPERLLVPALKREFPDADDQSVADAVSRSAGFLGQAREILRQGSSLPPQTLSFAQAFAKRDHLALLQLLVPMEKWKRDQLLPVLEQWRSLLADALRYRSGLAAPSPYARSIGTARSSRELMQAADRLEQAIQNLQGNISPAAVCADLVWALR